jgi:hypothetical protein
MGKSLRDLLLICEDDTKRLVSQGAANRLGAWRRYGTDADLISFIQRIIRDRDNQTNGFLIHSQRGVSLEAIVAIYRPELFDPEDIAIAQQTLGIV